MMAECRSECPVQRNEDVLKECGVGGPSYVFRISVKQDRILVLIVQPQLNDFIRVLEHQTRRFSGLIRASSFSGICFCRPSES